MEKFEGITKDNEYYKTVKGIMEYLGWHGKDIRFDKEENQVLFRHFGERNPEYANHLMIVVNCLDMDDPYHDETLHGHTGYHPETMLNYAKKASNYEMENLAKNLDTWYQDQI